MISPMVLGIYFLDPFGGLGTRCRRVPACIMQVTPKVPIGVTFGLYWDYIRIMEEKMELLFSVLGLGFRVQLSSCIGYLTDICT